jgi:two-component system sensor histidine kinase/response regulator
VEELTLDSTKPAQESGQDRVSILLVDDSPDKLLAIQSILEKLGQDLVKAHSGHEALRLILKREFALILLDVNMPGMDGFETASLIRQRQQTENTPIIFVTALSTTDADVFKGYAFGAVDYILTPIVPDILRTKVGVFVDLWKQKRALRDQAEKLRVLNEDLERRARQLADANRELEGFCYTVAHDLRAPLRAMEGLTCALADEYSQNWDATAHDYAARIRLAAERMDRMIQELLSYSRLALLEPELAPVDIEALFREVLQTLEWDLSQRNAVVKVKRCKTRVVANHTLAVQVFVNLIGNAIKFVSTENKPLIKVWTEEVDGGFLRIWVEDNGIGIAPEHHGRIFRVFERLHDRESYSGTGIGLAIVQKGVARMGGNVGLLSELGKGSRFWVELKCCETNPAP